MMPQHQSNLAALLIGASVGFGACSDDAESTSAPSPDAAAGSGGDVGTATGGGGGRGGATIGGSSGTAGQPGGAGAEAGAGAGGGGTAGSTGAGGNAAAMDAGGGAAAMDAGADAGAAMDASPDVTTADAAPPDGSPTADASLGDAAADGAPLACVDGGSTTGGAYEWDVYYPGAFADHLEVDSKGAAIVTGSFFGDMSVGGVPLSHTGGADPHVGRILPSGAVDWVRTYGGTGDEYPLNLVLDASDRIYLTGLYGGTGNVGGADLPPFQGTANRFDAFVAAYDASGLHRWSKSLNATGEVGIGAGLSVDDQGSLYIAGQERGVFGPGGLGDAGADPGAGSWDAYLARLDEPGGTFGFDVRIAGTSDERGVIAVHDGVGVTAVVQFSGSISVDTSVGTATLASNGGFDLVLLRLTPDGAITSLLQLGGDGNEVPVQGVLDDDGTVLVTGTTSSSDVVLGPGPAHATSGGDDVFVMRIDSSLAVLSSRTFGGTADDRPREIATASCGDFVMTGEFRNTMSLGSETLTASGPDGGGGPTQIDIFVAKFAADLRTRWARRFGGEAADRGLGIGADARGAVFVSAAFQSDVDFGGGVRSAGPGWSSAVVRLTD